MGFFSSAWKTLSGATKPTTQTSGTQNQLAPAFQQYSDLLQNTFKDVGLSTPTQAEQQAFSAIGRGVTPTPESLQADLSMLMNPYDQHVIDTINREAQGAGSLVNQYATQAGQQGSNRSFLGASDVEQQRLNQIGTFKQDQYNTALNQILGQMSGLKQQDIQNLLTQGQLETSIPYRDIAQFGDLLGIIPASAGTTSYETTPGKKGDFITGMTNVGKILGSVFGSDIRLKENIVKVGEKNGYNIYEFNYIGDNRKFRGVIAQEVQEIKPDAVHEVDGYLAVDYSKLGFDMEEVK